MILCNRIAVERTLQQCHCYLHTIVLAIRQGVLSLTQMSHQRTNIVWRRSLKPKLTGRVKHIIFSKQMESLSNPRKMNSFPIFNTPKPCRETRSITSWWRDQSQWNHISTRFWIVNQLIWWLHVILWNLTVLLNFFQEIVFMFLDENRN